VKKFSAQYVITNTGPLLKRGVITTDEDGKIISVDDTDGNLQEHQSIEFFNGIIIPGFVNCHCHLELSYLKGSIARSGGLGDFIQQVRNTRENFPENPEDAISLAEKEMYDQGVVLCADICNSSTSFRLKKESKTKFINLLEVFGIDPEKAGKRINEILSLAHVAGGLDLPYSIVPHSVYSVSLPLFRKLRQHTENNQVTSIHFMENPGEAEFIEKRSGSIMESYKQSGLLTANPETAGSHADAVLNEITQSGNLVLVHNLYTDIETIRKVRNRNNLYWCLCPNSNLYIENKLPPVGLLIEEGCEIVIGTDSLASNSKLNILEELKTLHLNFPSLSLEELIKWATLNGARALCAEENFGQIRPDTKPGLILIQNVDLINMKLLPESFVTRLV